MSSAAARSGKKRLGGLRGARRTAGTEELPFRGASAPQDPTPRLMVDWPRRRGGAAREVRGGRAQGDEGRVESWMTAGQEARQGTASNRKDRSARERPGLRAAGVIGEARSEGMPVRLRARGRAVTSGRSAEGGPVNRGLGDPDGCLSCSGVDTGVFYARGCFRSRVRWILLCARRPGAVYLTSATHVAGPVRGAVRRQQGGPRRGAPASGVPEGPRRPRCRELS